MNEVHGLAPSQDWFMHSLQSSCIGAMHKLVDCDSSGVNLEPFLIRNSVPQHQSFDSYSFPCEVMKNVQFGLRRFCLKENSTMQSS
ncbi:MAG: hypothetical protein QXR69_03915 [Conexivisphaerales archaeon]